VSYTDHPSAQPVRDAILANVVATVQAVAPPSYALGFRQVHDFNANALQDGAFVASPAAVITPGDESHDNGLPGRTECYLDVEVLVGVLGKDWRAQLGVLMASTAHALVTTGKRGGLAVWTYKTLTQVFDLGGEKACGLGRMVFQVYYRTLLDDPTQPC